jgi:hypothetical protein
MKFLVHFTGEWRRSSCGTSSIKTPSWVKEYASLDQVESIIDRHNFEWMLDTGEIVTSSGAYVWQIRGCNLV